ncbi:MAG: dephospho-CoA kinase [Candidatus Stygibacter australis]|nr:dephospho-CoA kinase [Candidatus Stygibacter australis]
MKQNKFSIAVTGGIGSGKSIVCQWFSDQGIPVISADILGHEALLSPAVQKKIIAEFGKSVVLNGNIDRQLLGNIVFDDADKTARLNAITHPYIISRIKKMLKSQKENLAVFEIPLLFEVGLENLFDKIVIVWAIGNIRVERLKMRRGMNERKISMIMAKQFSQETAKARADYVIVNNGSLEDLEKKLEELYVTLKQRI